MTFDQVLVKIRGDHSRQFRRAAWNVDQTNVRQITIARLQHKPPVIVGGSRVYADACCINGHDLVADDWEEVEA